MHYQSETDCHCGYILSRWIRMNKIFRIDILSCLFSLERILFIRQVHDQPTHPIYPCVTNDDTTLCYILSASKHMIIYC
jgi:hypothetical protein